MNMHLVLASASPRRRELLSHLTIPFTVWQHPFVEDSSRDSSPESIAVNLAVSKSDQIAGRIEEGDIVITADTIVWCNDKLLNKPADREEAISMLTFLSGKTHMVVTGVSLRSLVHTASFASVTGVRFRALSEEEIVFYVDNYSPYDKAGAYGIQEWIGYIAVESISGSYFNVMGLPVQKVYAELIKFTDS